MRTAEKPITEDLKGVYIKLIGMGLSRKLSALWRWEYRAQHGIAILSTMRLLDRKLKTPSIVRITARGWYLLLTQRPPR